MVRDELKLTWFIYFIFIKNCFHFVHSVSDIKSKNGVSFIFHFIYFFTNDKYLKLNLIKWIAFLITHLFWYDSNNN